jgi:hypothetical protein
MECTWKDWGSRRKTPIRIAVSCLRSRTGVCQNRYQSNQLARYGFFISSIILLLVDFGITLRIYGELYKLRCLSMCNFLHLFRQTARMLGTNILFSILFEAFLATVCSGVCSRDEPCDSNVHVSETLSMNIALTRLIAWEHLIASCLVFCAPTYQSAFIPRNERLYVMYVSPCNILM